MVAGYLPSARGFSPGTKPCHGAPGSRPDNYEANFAASGTIMVDPMFKQTVTRALSRRDLGQLGHDLLPRQPAPLLLGRAKEFFSHPDWTCEPN